MRTRHIFFMFLGALILSFSLNVSSPRAKDSSILSTFQAAINSASSVITVEKIGDGTGTVTSDIDGIDCGQDCTGAYPTNTTVTLTATTKEGFEGWGGACSGTSPSCTLKVTGNILATAKFVKKTLVREDGIWWGLHNGGRPTFYYTHYMKHYPPTFILTMEGCETVTVINNGHRFESSKLIAKQSDVSGRGMAVTTQSGQCLSSRASHILYYKEDMPVENPPLLIP